MDTHTSHSCGRRDVTKKKRRGFRARNMYPVPQRRLKGSVQEGGDERIEVFCPSSGVGDVIIFQGRF